MDVAKSFNFDLYWMYVNGHGGFAQNSGASWHDSTFLFPLAQAYYHTFGARVFGTIGIGCGLDYNVEAAIQTGTTHIAGIELDTDGITAEAQVGYTFTRKHHFRVFARGLYAEGADGDSAGYLINWPSRHSNCGFRARYGIADLIPMTNVHAAQLGVHFDPARNWTIGATALWAETDQDFGGGDNPYGEEIDVWAEYRYSPLITIGAGVALVIPDDAGEVLWGVTDDPQFVGYLQARLVF
jgi:Alginate export